MIKQRNPVLVLVLSIVTCGIYGLYWVYQSLHELEQTTGKTDSMNSMVVLLLCLFLPSVGYLLYGMVLNDQLNALRAMHGQPEEDNKVLYMILGFFIFVVLLFMGQSEINKFATE